MILHLPKTIKIIEDLCKKIDWISKVEFIFPSIEKGFSWALGTMEIRPKGVHEDLDLFEDLFKKNYVSPG